MRPFRKKTNLDNAPSIKKIDGFLAWEDIYQTLLSIKKESPDILIIWGGNAGEKARWFIEKTRHIHESGFSTTKKTILQSDFVSQCEQDPNMLMKLSEALSIYYEGNPALITRSSGQWDAHGVGIYESQLSVNTPTKIMEAFNKVYDSNGTFRANEYRRILWISSKEMWIFIEPCIWNIYYNKHIWPELSWRWKTNESWILELWISQWIGWGVRDRSYYKILIDRYLQSTIGDYIEDDKESYLSKYFSNASIFRQYNKKEWLYLPMYWLESHRITTIEISEELKKEIYNFSLSSLAKSIKKLEKKVKIPQYFERASVYKGKWIFETYLTQLADTIYNTLNINLKQNWKCLTETHTTIGSWIREFDKVLLIDLEWEDIFSYNRNKKDLLAYNQKNENYLLIISDMASYWNSDLNLEEYSNAGAIIEIAHKIWHSGDPSGHYTWLMSAVNILFSIINNDKISHLFKDISSQNFNNNRFLKEFTDNTFILAQDARAWVWKLFLKE